VIDIEVKGFQSIEHTHIKVEGFSALVGRSNIGKSAFVRAVRTALTNPPGTSFVRHGQDCARLVRKNGKTCKCSSSVHIRTKGLDLLWEKGDAVNRYVFNTQIYDKPGQGVPDFLAEAGFAPVEIGGKANSIQVADQFFPIFLLDQSGPAIAEAISDVSRLDQINAATRLAEKDRRDVIAKRKVREEDVRELETQLTEFEGLDSAIKELQEVGSSFLALVQAQSRVQQLGRFLGALEVLVVGIRRLQEAANIDVDEPVELERAFAKTLQCHRFDVDFDALTLRVNRLHEASQYDVEDLDTLTAKSSSIQVLKRYQVELDRRSKDVEGVSWVENDLRPFPEEDPLSEPAGKLSKLGLWVSQINRNKGALAPQSKLLAEDLPDTLHLEEQNSKLKTLSSLISKVTTLPPLLRGLAAQATTLEAEESVIEGEIDALGVCPTCVRPVREEHTHA